MKRTVTAITIELRVIKKLAPNEQKLAPNERGTKGLSAEYGPSSIGWTKPAQKESPR
jgi:hypothetical protein